MASSLAQVIHPSFFGENCFPGIGVSLGLSLRPNPSQSHAKHHILRRQTPSKSSLRKPNEAGKTLLQHTGHQHTSKSILAMWPQLANESHYSQSQLMTTNKALVAAAGIENLWIGSCVFWCSSDGITCCPCCKKPPWATSL